MKHTTTGVLTLFCLMVFPPLHAEEFAGLEEIVVTATKRTQSLQEVGMSVTALTTADIEDMGMDDYLDFAVRVPNMGTSYQADGRFDANSPAIRGIDLPGDEAGIVAGQPGNQRRDLFGRAGPADGMDGADLAPDRGSAHPGADRVDLEAGAHPDLARGPGPRRGRES